MSIVRAVAEDAVKNILKAIGENPEREGLRETPKRVVNSWDELFSGYRDDPKDHVKLFESESRAMVICKDIEFYSMCEHHMLPFHGKLHIGYIPGGRVIGLSKLARIADVFARRLQIQEGLTNEIADFLEEHLYNFRSIGAAPEKSVMVVAEAKHHCMCGRGVNKQHSTMITSAVRGAFEDTEVRSEFLELIKH